MFVENNSIFILGYAIKNTALISFLTAIAFLIIVITSPLLSGISDYIGNKKVFMKTFVYIGSISCIGLYWFDLENIYLGLLLYFLGLIGFWSSLVFYNSYLPDLVSPKDQDKVSAQGYAMGYIGSVLLLILNLLMIMQPQWFGISAPIQAMKISFITVGIWWLIFSQYCFYYLPKGNKKTPQKTKKLFGMVL